MITGTGYRINLLKDLSVTPTVSLPDSMQTGDTITPIFTNIIDGVDLSKAFTYKWNNGSYDIYNGASSPMLTKSGTLKLTVSPKNHILCGPVPTVIRAVWMPGELFRKSSMMSFM